MVDGMKGKVHEAPRTPIIIIIIIAITITNKEAMRWGGKGISFGGRYISSHLPVVSSWPTIQPSRASCKMELMIPTWRVNETVELPSQSLTCTGCSINRWQSYMRNWDMFSWVPQNLQWHFIEWGITLKSTEAYSHLLNKKKILKFSCSVHVSEDEEKSGCTQELANGHRGVSCPVVSWSPVYSLFKSIHSPHCNKLVRLCSLFRKACLPSLYHFLWKAIIWVLWGAALL